MQPVASLDFRLFQDPISKLKPPLFRYAWRIGHDRMEEIVLSQFRDAVRMVDRPPDFNGQDEYGDLVDLPDNADSSLCASMIATVVSVDLMIAIAERIGLPDTFLDQLNFVPMCDSQGTMEWGLEVGTNYTCVIPPEFIEALKKILDTTEEPMWYLDPFEWQWRAAPKRKGKNNLLPFTHILTSFAF